MSCGLIYLNLVLAVFVRQTARLLGHPDTPRLSNGQGVFFNHQKSVVR